MPADNDLQDESRWDWEKGEMKDPSPRSRRRAVVSVSFPSSDFQLVARSARQSGMKTSEFIRVGALEKASRQGVSFGFRIAAGVLRNEIGSQAQTEAMHYGASIAGDEVAISA